ncbi:MAG: hypothetical protein GF320_11205 [Armatimonadia bacterium]|nr:hypothetical protein [Armatimonadia bacterium]
MIDSPTLSSYDRANLIRWLCLVLVAVIFLIGMGLWAPPPSQTASRAAATQRADRAADTGTATVALPPASSDRSP